MYREPKEPKKIFIEDKIPVEFISDNPAKLLKMNSIQFSKKIFDLEDAIRNRDRIIDQLYLKIDQLEKRLQ